MEVPEIYIILICSVVAFWISKKGIPLLLLIAQKKKLFDDGNDVRKLHNGLIPTLGGVAIFTALLVTFSASSFAGEIHGFGYLVSASIILFVAGLKDDLIVISPVKKLAAQVLATALIIFGCGLQFSHMGGVFGVSAISGWVAIPLTFFTVIVVINAQNLIDGIDGLGGSIGVLASVFFGCWFYMAEVYPWAVLSFILAGSILGFLWYNRPPAQIFMGDTGSLIIGFFLAVLAINFVEYSINGPEVVYWQSASPVVVAAVLAVPLYDTLRVFIVRVVQGRSPFEADKEHVHHHLLKVGFSHGQAVVFLLTINIIIMGSVIIMSGYLSNTWLLVFLMSLSMAVFPTNQWKRRFLDVFISDRWMIKDKQKEVLEQPSPSPPSDDLLAEEKSKEREERKTLMEV